VKYGIVQKDLGIVMKSDDVLVGIREVMGIHAITGIDARESIMDMGEGKDKAPESKWAAVQVVLGINLFDLT
jgi:hypothetical protein